MEGTHCNACNSHICVAHCAELAECGSGYVPEVGVYEIQIQGRDTANLNSQPGHPKGQAGSGSRARPGSGTESICHRTLPFTPGVNAKRSPDGDGVTNQIRLSPHGRHPPHSSAPPSVQMTNA